MFPLSIDGCASTRYSMISSLFITNLADIPGLCRCRNFSSVISFCFKRVMSPNPMPFPTQELVWAPIVAALPAPTVAAWLRTKGRVSV